MPPYDPKGSKRPPSCWSRAFWAVAALFTVGMAFTTVPTPLYPIYEDQRGYGPATITLIFAVYPVGVVAAFFWWGHVSDVVGRRRTLVAALALETLSAAAFALSSALWILLAARVICGIGVGLLMTTATAYLGELEGRARRDAPPRVEIVTTAAIMGGFGLGALTAGLLAATGHQPLRLPFVVFFAVLAAATAVATRLPETLLVRARRWPAPHPQRLVIAPHTRSTFAAASATAFVAFAMLSLVMAFAPTLLADSLRAASPALAGALACSCTLAAGLGQLGAARLDPAHALSLGVCALTGGVLATGMGAALALLPLFLGGAVIGGVGSGVLTKRALAITGRIAPAHARAETFAGFYLIVYLNATVPVVALGLLAQNAGTVVAVAAYAGMMLAILAAAVPVVQRATRHTAFKYL